MPESLFELFDEYAAAYARGERPRAEDYLDRAGPDRGQLASVLDEFVRRAPAPPPTEDDKRYLGLMLADEPPLLSLRVERGMRVEDVVGALIDRLGLEPKKRAKVKSYYQRLEGGLLDPLGLSERLPSRSPMFSDLMPTLPRPGPPRPLPPHPRSSDALTTSRSLQQLRRTTPESRRTRSIVSSPEASELFSFQERPALHAGLIETTIGDMPGPVTDVRAGVLRRRFHQQFGGAEVPVPVEAIAEDLCGLVVEEVDDLDVSGMLIPAERRIFLNAAEPAPRRRFTLAHELGHWICQCLDGRGARRYCRAEDVGLDRTAKAFEREANVFAAELLMPEADVRAGLASLEEVAARFAVSEEAMNWRLYNLGLVDEAPR